MIAFGSEPGPPILSLRCGDCGVVRGGHHHLGCDMQRCPLCRGQMMLCDCRFDEDGPDEDEMDDVAEPLFVDGNGVPAERRWVGGTEVVVRYDNIPASDITTVDGIPCTTALRTVIDLAPEIDPAELEHMVRDFLDRRLFTVEEAWRRLAQPDMATRTGAGLLRQLLPRMS